MTEYEALLMNSPVLSASPEKIGHESFLSGFFLITLIHRGFRKSGVILCREAMRDSLEYFSLFLI